MIKKITSGLAVLIVMSLSVYLIITTNSDNQPNENSIENNANEVIEEDNILEDSNVSDKDDSSSEDDISEDGNMIKVSDGNNVIIFELNDSEAARDLYNQLPLTIEVENFSSNEKIFYPSNELNTSGTPQAEGGVGTLAYYAPWGDVVMFYDNFSPSSGLYELGEAIEGVDLIRNLTGQITIERIEN